jgi:RNA polymerase sigma-70 factor (ECF subfamily)
MSHESMFEDFIRRIRAGDEQAAAELVRKYEPVIRLEVRMRLTDPSLYRLFDSMDICQSVLASFFLRAASGQYDLNKPEQLLKLLVAMTRNKLAFQARKHHYQRRDQRRVAAVPAEELQRPARDPSPSDVVAGKELLEEFRRRLSDEERQLAELRAQDCGWNEIATKLGGTAQARRKQLERAVDRVSRELGLDQD